MQVCGNTFHETIVRRTPCPVDSLMTVLTDQIFARINFVTPENYKICKIYRTQKGPPNSILSLLKIATYSLIHVLFLTGFRM